MKNTGILLCITIIMAACKSAASDDQKVQPKQPSTVVQKVSDPEPAISYPDFLQEVQAKRKKLQSGERYFFSIMARDIPQYWMGTPWDFNGTTTTPQQGQIACGYFVTTTLKQLGFDLNRIKLAQQPASAIVAALCTDIKKHDRFDTLIDYLNGQPDSSVYIIGLDYHVGFLLRESENRTFFLHSNYIQRQGVVKEVIQNAQALAASETYITGTITGNRKLMKAWAGGN